MRLSRMPAATRKASLPVLSRLRPTKAPGLDMNLHCRGFKGRSSQDYHKLMTEKVLRAKYGPPQGSKFTISAGFEIVVDCEPYGQVRRIEFPGTAHDASGASTPQRVDEVVLELVPMSIRGKEISL